MREILFRGKRFDINEWVIGFYTENAFVPGFVIQTKELDFHVIPETVGQYTGLKDKNGVRIFEGDIIQQYQKNDDNEYDYSYYDIGAVFFDENKTGFYRTSKNFPDRNFLIAPFCEYEVVGNIYDNP